MKFAVVRVRGLINIRKKVQDTLHMLGLHNKNYCVIVEDSPQMKGMLKKVKDYITYGEIKDDLINELIEKRGEEYKGPVQDSKGKITYKRFREYNNKKYKKFFRLSPPLKGYGRKGIKKPFSKGGALGNRKEKITDLLKRMI